MIARIVETSLKLRFLMLAAAAALLAFGWLQLGRTAIDVLPEFAPPTVEVQTEAIGLSAEEVESLITLGLEELLSGVPWLDSTRSRSVTGLSTITLIFKRGTDIIKARQMVQERLALEYKLPNVATPPVILQPVSATNRFMMIAISSDTIEPTELSLLARWTIKPRLVGVPGVANVAIWGQRLRQMHVHVHPERLRDARLTQEEIIAAAGDALWVSPLTFLKASATGSGGWIDNANQRLGVEHKMPIEKPEDMAKVVVASEPELKIGRTVALGDVSEVTFSHPPLIGDAFVSGANGVKPGGGLLLVLEKFPSANVPQVTQQVEAALAEIARGLPGVKIDTSVYRLATYIDESLAHLLGAASAAALLLVLVVGALLRSWRAAVVLLAAVGLSLLATVAVLHLAGVTLNVMVLGGLVVALAVIVGEATADVAAMVARLRTRQAGESAVAVIASSLRETRAMAVVAGFVVVLSVVPILAVSGVQGAILEPFAVAYLLAIAAAMVVALTATPALCLLLAPPAGSAREPARIAAHCEPLLRRGLAAPRAAFIAAGILVLAGAAAWPLLGDSLLPPLHDRGVVVSWNTPPGTSHPETQRIVARVGSELRAIPGVRSVGAHIGRAITGDQIVGVNSSQIWVGIAPDADAEATTAQVREVVNGYPGIESGMHNVLQQKVNDALTGESNSVVVRIYGPRREFRQQQAERVRQSIADVKGLVDLRVEGEIEEPQVQVKLNLEAAGKADVKPGDARRASATVFGGIVVGYLFREQKIFEVVVWGAPEARQSLSNLGELWIDKSDRTRVRLRDVADIHVAATPTVIRHERIAPYVDVVANVAGRDLGAVADELQGRLRKMSFPLEHRAELLGETVERGKARQRTVGIVAAALVGIFLLLQAGLRSWGRAAVAFAGVLAAMAGGILAGWAVGAGGLLGTLLGLLAVLAIAARNGMLMVDEYRKLEDASGAALGLDQVASGALRPLASICTSAAAISAVLLPLAVLGRMAGLEIASAIAIVMLGGLAASVLVSLFVVPALVLRVRANARPSPDLGLGEA